VKIPDRDEVKALNLGKDAELDREFAPIYLHAGDRVRQSITQIGNKAIYIVEVDYRIGRQS
jgi:hypothetical protein